MKNNEYWAKRFKALEERSNEEAQKCVAESVKLIDDAIIQIDKDITYWLKRFADNNNMTLAEAKKAITNKELKELGWDVEEYIRKGYANSYLGNWDKELENASAKYHITRLDAIKMQMMLFCDKAFADITENVTQTLSNVYKDVYYRTAFEVQKGIGVGFSFAQVDERRLKLILEKPWAIDGTNFSERIWGTYRPKLTNKLQQALTDWCVRGTDPKKLARQLSYESNVAQSACNTLIRTETAQICTRAEMDSYDELGVEKYRVLETLDGKTCDMCADMDSKIFNRDDFEIGITAPPFHPRCRGTTIPEVTDELLKQGRKRAARDPETGKTIYIDDMSYTDWKEKFVSNDKFTNEDNGVIIKNEQQRNGRNKNTTINHTYINSGEYRKKFDNITDNKVINRIIYQKAKEMLNHRSGTLIEDMYWFDGDNGKIVASVLDETVKEGIVYTKSVNRAILGKDNLITAHTHPNSLPPSISDINSAVRNGYKTGIVLCHDGKVFKYSASEEISENLYNMYASEISRTCKTEYEIQMKTLIKLQDIYDLVVEEVN